MRKLLILFCIVLLYTGCSGSGQEEETYVLQLDTIQEQNDECTSKDYEPVESTDSSNDDVSATESSSPSDSEQGTLSGKTICIDPGHCVTNEKQYEQISPKSNETKNVFGGGTSGKNQTEEKLNLSVGLKLKDALKTEGAEVIMTREVSEIAINNIERAQIGNSADCCIRIHADGVDDSSVHGVSVLVPAGDLLGNPEIIEPSRTLGQLMVDCVSEQTGARNRGVVNRSDLVGFNWSEVPSVLIEMGFMTNPEEDALLESEEYQQKIVQGIVQSIILWFTETT